MSGAKGPTWHVPTKEDRRDVYTEKHRTPRSGVPTFVEEECTGKYEGEDLRRIRAKRPTSKRLEILEAKDDEHARDIGEIKEAVADIRGDQKAQNVSLEFIKKHIERADKREDVEFVDAVAARKAKREAVLKVALYIITGGLVGKILHTLGML